MNKLELLVTLVRAIDNSPKGKFTLSGPSPAAPATSSARDLACSATPISTRRTSTLRQRPYERTT